MALGRILGRKFEGVLLLA